MHLSARRLLGVALAGIAAVTLAGTLAVPAQAQSAGGRDHRHDVVRTGAAGHRKARPARRTGDITRLHAAYRRKSLRVSVHLRRLGSAAHTRVIIPLRITYPRNIVFPAWGPPSYRILYNAHRHRAHLQQTTPGQFLFPIKWKPVKGCRVVSHHGRAHVRLRYPRSCLRIARAYGVGAHYIHRHGKVRFTDTWRNHGSTWTPQLRRG